MSMLNDDLRRRVLLLDGSMGVMIQRMSLPESRFRGRHFETFDRPLKGNNDILNLTAPDVIASIHRSYLEAGADIIETNTFNATVLSQREYATEHLVREINLAGARLAREEAERFSTPQRRRYVAGAMGPTGLSASLPSDINDPSQRTVDYDEMKEAFAVQAGALIDGGVDLMLIETVFDVLNAKAAVAGVQEAMKQRTVELPIILSITISDTSGRLLSGHTPEAFLSIVKHARPLAVGFNCSAGPESLSNYLRRLASISPYATIFYPNAGLPDSLGNYDETPEKFAGTIAPLLRDRQLNIVGGCCGTTPTHIKALADKIEDGAEPRLITGGHDAWLAGLEEFADNRGFINIGERCNVAGSRKFLRLIKEKNYTEAVAIAAKQVTDGAMILDINMDDGMLDSEAEMKHFLRLLAANPSVASVPWMIDSSDFNVIKTALSNIPGRAIVNSISLKNGEPQFLQHAREIRELGAAVVVMAFDENGQATTFERKIEICRRAYRLLTEEAGYDPRDIIFDPNVLTIATGMKEHDRYALDFIKAVEWIGKNLPGAKTSGG
ncbi:MAG: homocysteine S-methyltransferase family protein, partial [Muribaculaceae bacterium]|nr:homocysteine S-methyltransferase family protein [Muribaculaceae bacterium]